MPKTDINITPTDALETVERLAESFLSHWEQDDGMDEAEQAEVAEARDGFTQAIELLRANLASTPQIIIKVSGGRVQGTVANVDCDILILDYDIDSVPPDEYEDGGIKAYPEDRERDKPADHWEEFAEAYDESPLVDAEYTAQLIAIAERTS
jgi:hypothetical protein